MNVVAAQFTASVDRNPVTLDESFTLRLKARGSVERDPDLSPLSKDFEILGTSKSTSMNYVNGNFSRESTWNISLISKKTGTLTIPSIQFGSEQSPALRITVNENSASAKQAQQREIYLEAETDTDNTWVQGQVIYTVRLFRTVDINNASLSPPRTNDPDAIIEKLGDDANYESFRDGVRYDVIERRYAIFPQRSGELTIEPTLFEGRVGQRRSMFDSMYSNNKIKRVRSQGLSVNIQSKPAGVNGNWLPAKQLSLVEEWSQPLESLSAGEPVTRTITINASGVLFNQINDPEFADIEGIKQYPDQPQGDNAVSKEGIEATRQIKLALIPAAGGRYTIPELTLPWWNTTTGEAEIARLPAREITVAGDAVASDTQQAPQPVTVTTPVTVQGDASQDESHSSSIWPWVSLALAIAWAITLVLLLRGNTAKAESRPSLAQLKNSLLQACERNDIHASKQHLLSWAQLYWPMQRVNNLMDIAGLLDKDIADHIRELNSTLYSGHAEQWDGRMLANKLRALADKPDMLEPSIDPVEPLYRA